ncbi:hypothetical protein BHE74_00047227 [Ensete ventricosum]|nr:hypothetical protein GW17_00051933 [Ensete ventricosum]RWW46819.1 hypothetical protein BHE74_00047227 [Ensete ventricosum]
MRSFFNVDSTVTTRRLVKVRKKYFIPPEYELYVPQPRERPYDTFSYGFSLSTDALEAGLRFPLHPVIESCLELWRISPSQMVPNSWRYLVAFLWECYLSGIRVTQELLMACFWLSQGQAMYYLVAHSGFHVRGAPSNNKGWKLHFFFFISYCRGWSFPTEWTSRTISSSVPVLSINETELVEILQGILSTLRGVKDMNEAWLVEAGLSSGGMFSLFIYRVRVFLNHTFCCAEMFNLGKMKSSGGAGSGSVAPSATSAPTARDARVFMVEKHPSSGTGAGLRKHLRKVAAKQPTDTSRSTARTSADKGKGMVELEKVPKRGYTMRELCEVEDREGADRYFTSIMMWLKCTNGEDPLVPRWSTISGSSPFWTEVPLSGEYLWGA